MFSRTTCMITNVKIQKRLDQIFRANRFIVVMELFPFLMKHFLMNFVSRPPRAVVLCILLCIILHEICTPIYANGRFLVLFFFARKKNCHRHVNGFGDLPSISLVCNRARSLKKYFPFNKQLGEKRETFTNMKTCKGTCGTCTLVSHS